MGSRAWWSTVHGAPKSQTWLSNWTTNRCVVVSHCCTLQFLDDIWCRTCFHMLVCHLYLFGELSFENLCSLLNWIVHFYCWVLWVFRMLWVTIFYQISFCKHFLSVSTFSSHSLTNALRTEILHFNEVQLNYFSHGLCLQFYLKVKAYLKIMYFPCVIFRL